MRNSVLSTLCEICLWPIRVAHARRVLAELAALDDRGLADIGLGRHDLRDMTACALGEDPTNRLAERARERARAALAGQPTNRPPGPTRPPGKRADLAA
jgi:uncharacterized protein YjiS (DUF1127 family)